MGTTNKKTNKSNVANENAASKDQIKFSGEVDDAVNDALAAYAAERAKLCPKLADKPISERALNGSSANFEIGDVVSKGKGWSLKQSTVTRNGVVENTFPSITNGIDTIALKALCKMIVTGFSTNPNDTFYNADNGPEEGTTFADIPDVQKANPTVDTQDMKKIISYMNGKPNYTPIRLYCEIIAGNISLENLESLTFHGYIYRQGVERGTNRPYFNRIPLWSIKGKIID